MIFLLFLLMFLERAHASCGQGLLAKYYNDPSQSSSVLDGANDFEVSNLPDPALVVFENINFDLQQSNNEHTERVYPEVDEF